MIRLYRKKAHESSQSFLASSGQFSDSARSQEKQQPTRVDAESGEAASASLPSRSPAHLPAGSPQRQGCLLLLIRPLPYRIQSTKCTHGGPGRAPGLLFSTGRRVAGGWSSKRNSKICFQPLIIFLFHSVLQVADIIICRISLQRISQLFLADFED